MMQRAVQFLQKEQLIWGPIFLLCTLALAVTTEIPLDLLGVAVLGFFLSACLRIRGYCYSLVLLAVASVARHAFWTTNHLWYLGIEGSLGCAFFITALGFEQGAEWIQSLQMQIETRKSSADLLEEEVGKLQELSQQQQILFQEKIGTLQKDLEDLQTEHSSILILNEVLRKTTARHTKEAETAAAFLDEYQACKEELKRLKATDSVVIQNRELMEELNQARCEKEQIHLINETLTRLHYKEALKAQEAEQDAASLEGQLRAAHDQVQKIKQPLEEQVAILRIQIKSLESDLEKNSKEANRAREQLLQLQDIQTERNFFRQRVQAAEVEIALLQTRPVSREIEAQFAELRKQFEEKNQVLHQVRSELFKTDTELQKVRMEKGALELQPLPKEVEEELQSLGEQLGALEEENQELQELITLLSDPTKVKKKVKMARMIPEQELLF